MEPLLHEHVQDSTGRNEATAEPDMRDEDTAATDTTTMAEPIPVALHAPDADAIAAMQISVSSASVQRRRESDSDTAMASALVPHGAPSDAAAAPPSVTSAAGGSAGSSFAATAAAAAPLTPTTSTTTSRRPSAAEYEQMAMSEVMGAEAHSAGTATPTSAHQRSHSHARPPLPPSTAQRRQMDPAVQLLTQQPAVPHKSPTAARAPTSPLPPTAGSPTAAAAAAAASAFVPVQSQPQAQQLIKPVASHVYGGGTNGYGQSLSSSHIASPVAPRTPLSPLASQHHATAMPAATASPPVTASPASLLSPGGATSDATPAVTAAASASPFNNPSLAFMWPVFTPPQPPQPAPQPQPQPQPQSMAYASPSPPSHHAQHGYSPEPMQSHLYVDQTQAAAAISSPHSHAPQHISPPTPLYSSPPPHQQQHPSYTHYASPLSPSPAALASPPAPAAGLTAEQQALINAGWQQAQQYFAQMAFGQQHMQSPPPMAQHMPSYGMSPYNSPPPANNYYPQQQQQQPQQQHYDSPYASANSYQSSPSPPVAMSSPYGYQQQQQQMSPPPAQAWQGSPSPSAHAQSSPMSASGTAQAALPTGSYAPPYFSPIGSGGAHSPSPSFSEPVPPSSSSASASAGASRSRGLVASASPRLPPQQHGSLSTSSSELSTESSDDDSSNDRHSRRAQSKFGGVAKKPQSQSKRATPASLAPLAQTTLARFRSAPLMGGEEGAPGPHPPPSPPRAQKGQKLAIPPPASLQSSSPRPCSTPDSALGPVTPGSAGGNGSARKPSWKVVSATARRRAEVREAIAAKERALGNRVAGDRAAEREARARDTPSPSTTATAVLPAELTRRDRSRRERSGSVSSASSAASKASTSSSSVSKVTKKGAGASSTAAGSPRNAVVGALNNPSSDLEVSIYLTFIIVTVAAVVATLLLV